MDWIVMEISLLIMEKSWNCVFEFLWEPCYMYNFHRQHSLLKHREHSLKVRERTLPKVNVKKNHI